MKKIIVLAAFLATQSGQAGACVQKYSDEIIKTNSAVMINDKQLHCAVSCSLALRCYSAEVTLLGFAKEAIDIFGPGTADLADLKANLYGIKLAYRGHAKDDNACTSICRITYRD